MAFGFKQLSKPTPALATWVFRIVLYGVGLSKIICSIITEIPPEINTLINHYGLEAILLVHAVSKMFGLPLPDDAQISAKDVASVSSSKPETNPPLPYSPPNQNN